MTDTVADADTGRVAELEGDLELEGSGDTLQLPDGVPTLEWDSVLVAESGTGDTLALTVAVSECDPDAEPDTVTLTDSDVLTLPVQGALHHGCRG